MNASFLNLSKIFDIVQVTAIEDYSFIHNFRNLIIHLINILPHLNDVIAETNQSKSKCKAFFSFLPLSLPLCELSPQTCILKYRSLNDVSNVPNLTVAKMKIFITIRIICWLKG